jgi:hypothetical protein
MTHPAPSVPGARSRVGLGSVGGEALPYPGGEGQEQAMAEQEARADRDRDEPERDLKEEPAAQRSGEGPEDLLRRSAQEQAEWVNRVPDTD